MELQHYKEILKKKLSSKRYNHSIQVLETALKLAEKMKIDKERLAVASLLHDYAKELPKERLIEIYLELYPDKKREELNVAILHSDVGAYLVEKELNIKDKEILNAIKYHTTGRDNMSEIEKIVYLADAIEPTRDYPIIERISEIAEKNLDEALLLEVTEKIKFLKERDISIDTNSLKLLNWLSEKKR